MVAWCEETSAVHGSGAPVTTKLHRIAEKARKDPGFKFTSLYHPMNKELLRGCFQWLRKDAAAGIDKMTKDMYAENLEGNLSNLVGRLHRMAYIPQAVRRKYIAEPGSAAKQRPLGIPCLEDKLVQAGLVRIMESVYEQDFIEDSYGFRPSRSCHQALRALSETVEDRPVNHIVEADIKGFFDNVNQEWLKKARTLKTKELWKTAKAKLRGHYNYYGVTDNLRGIARFGREVRKLLFKWLNRRGKRGCLSWEKFAEMLKRFPLPKPRIMVSMFGSSVN